MLDQLTPDQYSEITEYSYRYSRKLLFSHHEAEDFGQEVLLRLAKRTENITDLRAFVHEIAHGIVADECRKRDTKRDKHDEIRDRQAAMQKLADQPIESMVLHEDYDLIRARIDEAPEPFRSFLSETILVGKSNADALADLGIHQPEANWKRRRSRFVAKLRAELADNQ